MKSSLSLLLLSITWLLTSCRDDSSAAFLTPQFAHLSHATQDFPFFWKGVLLLDVEHPEAPAFKQKICLFLKQETLYVDAFYCHPNLYRQNPEQLRDWIRDYSLRAPLPSPAELALSSQKSIAMATLPGISHEMLGFLRLDPFATSQNYLELKQENIQLSPYAIPLAFKHSPQETDKTEALLNLLSAHLSCDPKKSSCPDYILSGPHAANFINKQQVISDLSLVSLVGFLLLLLHSVVLGYRRGLTLLWLSFLLIPAVLMAVGITVLSFGSIYGLTLAFGPGLIGLALDYGMHAKIHERLEPEKLQKVWRSNFFGLLTTLAGFVCLIFSEIPLLRQLAVFTFLGLSFAFATYYLLSGARTGKPWRIWELVKFDSFQASAQRSSSALAGYIMAFLALCSLVLWPLFSVDLNLKNFEYRSQIQKKLEKAFFRTQKLPEVLFSVEHSGDSASSYVLKAWAESEDLSLENWAAYIPSLATQRENLKSWRSPNCKKTFQGSSASQPFYQSFDELAYCETLTRRVFLRDLKNPPSYLHDYVSQSHNGNLLNVWFPKNEESKNKILKNFPQTASLKMTFEKFPLVLLHELSLMFPVGFLLCFALIFYHMRRIRYSLFALLPMFSSIGLVFLVFALSGKSLSFVGCVALLMIFGTSVDYGIFQVDAHRTLKGETKAETFSSLFMSASTTFLGYLPLVFAKHPVLHDLGVVLSLGTLGALLGGIWGIPYFIEDFER